MHFTTWLTFFFAACVIAVSPGSGAVLSMSHGLNYGVKKTSGTIMGLQAGLLLILAIAGAGVGSILMASEFAFSVVKTVGALYLIYLGINQWRARVDVVTDNDTASVSTQVPSMSRRFLTGFLTNATNPKGIIFMVAVLPQFISHDAPLLPQLLILGVTMCLIDLVVMHGYAFAASSMQRYFRDPKWLKSQNRFFGGVLMAIGTALFFVKRSPSS
ncbi:LysE family transporter [Undibacterium pigrum]|uniref:Homoserine/homoserine lactone efflux protein n=1 Tax=Undibacterium pigrum TaxID=401470 RepID=A0A318J8Z0_9BURK|nr:LysE family transporter [Undibacterium pigrum]PXX45539.1 homoserine/homoserine lactone efflux protein [Undibacterium pigrum]